MKDTLILLLGIIIGGVSLIGTYQSESNMRNHRLKLAVGETLEQIEAKAERCAAKPNCKLEIRSVIMPKKRRVVVTNPDNSWKY